MNFAKTKGKRGNNSWLVTLPLVGLTVAYVFLFFRPEVNAIASLQAELETKEAVLAASQGQAQQLAASRRAISRTHNYVKDWRDRMSESQAPLLFGAITQQSQSAGAQVISFDPEPAVALERLQRIPLTIQCRGSLTSLDEVLRRLESLPQSIWVEDVHLEKVGENDGVMTCKIKLAIFASKTDYSD